MDRPRREIDPQPPPARQLKSAPEPLEAYLARQSALVEKTLKGLLPPARRGTLHEAVRYSLLAGGKRLRPILCLAAAEACGARADAALPAACAVECVHTYSLVHDDLPCMDDDDLRRGRPTCHVKFGEGMAVLAGDALLTHAFEFLAAARPPRNHTVADMVRELAIAAGATRLIAVQAADLEAEGKKIPAARLRFIHEGKTAAMISVSLRLGGMSAGASPARLDALGNFGRSLGLAFQVIDDILDVTQPSEVLGKSAGKDIRDQKSTYPSTIGLEASRREARRLTTRAKSSLRPLGGNASRLLEIADHLLGRKF